MKRPYIIIIHWLGLTAENQCCVSMAIYKQSRRSFFILTFCIILSISQAKMWYILLSSEMILSIGNIRSNVCDIDIFQSRLGI